MENGRTAKQQLDEACALLAKNQFIRAAEAAAAAEANGISELESLRIQLFAYNRMQWLLEAGICAKRLKALKGLQRDHLLEIALFNVLLGDAAQAIKYFKRAIKKSPNDALLYSELAITFEQSGEPEKSLAIYEKIITRSLKHREIGDLELRVFSRAVNLRALTLEEVECLTDFYGNNKPNLLGIRAAYILAKAYRKLGSVDAEIKWLDIANYSASKQDAKAGNVWSEQVEIRRTALIKQQFASAEPKWIPDFERDNKRYIFILGMPRSGTTLLEQIIGAHSQVDNSGETRALDVALTKLQRSLGQLAASGPFSSLENLRLLSGEQFHKLAENYSRYQSLFSSKECLTDKALTNINWVGLLANLFPFSRFIFIERGALDNCISLLQHDLGNAPYSSNPEYCVLEHAQYHERAMHWRKLYPKRFLALTYEGLVAEPNVKIQSIVRFLELQWEPEIMQFHKRKNSVRTPSVGQVRSAISAGQIGKWKKYRSLLKPAIRHLESRPVNKAAPE